MIAMQYLFTGHVHGVVRWLLRLRLPHAARVPGHRRARLLGIVSPTEYNALVTNHGSIMIFWVAMPVLIAAFGNFLIPLMIGADDMVFPKLNRLSYQIFLLSAHHPRRLVLRRRAAPSAAPGRPTRRSRQGEYSLTPLGSTLWLLAVALEFVAFLLGGINFITTAMNSARPGHEDVGHPDGRSG
jgi:cytochrome c oxidase subunit 1